MSKTRKVLRSVGLIFFSAFMVSVGTFALAQTQQKPASVNPQTGPGVPSQTPPKQCCIAGEYEGYRKDRLPATKSCPKPEEGPYKMVIYQQEKCGSKIWGKVIGKDGSVQEFTGSVTTGPKGCCNIQGIMKRPVEETRFKGTLCLKGGKWVGKGDYTNKRDGILCTGKWEMKQM